MTDRAGDHQQRLFAVVPAAGHSRRMGTPKLLLPLGGKTVIARLLEALLQSGVTETFVVVRPGDDALHEEVDRTGAVCVVPPISPPDMRDSVEFALAEIRRRHAPRPEEGWMLIPADHPVLDRAVLTELIGCWHSGNQLVLVPSVEGQRGHPTFFRWGLAAEVAAIPADRGLNWLVQRHAGDVVEVAVASRAVLTDLDTPSDYDRLREYWT